MNSCVFIIYATSLTDAIEKEKMLANVVLRKYNMEEYKDNNGNPMHAGGYSPLWNGDWKHLAHQNTCVQFILIY